MKFPKRAETHLIEAKSWKILQSAAPEEWIVREVTERDYGLDCYIELASKNGDVTGDLISVQMKGVKNLKWKKNDKNIKQCRSPSVKTSTAAYWLRLPVPVFLFVAELSSNDIYFSAVDVSIRKQFELLNTQNTMSFNLVKDFSLRSRLGQQFLLWMYKRERTQADFVFYVSNLIAHVSVFCDFILNNIRRDSFMEVETEQHLQFRALYQTCKMASLYAGEDWPLESLNELYIMDHKQWNDDFIYFHEGTQGYALEKISKIFPDLVRKCIEVVTESQKAYWRAKDPMFFTLCTNNDVSQHLSRVEASAPYF